MCDTANSSGTSSSINKVFLSSLEIGRLTFVINIRNRGRKKISRRNSSSPTTSEYIKDDHHRSGSSGSQIDRINVRSKMNGYSAAVLLGQEFVPEREHDDDDPPQAELIRSIIAKLPYITSIR